MIVNNSFISNKTKESLKSDSQQFLHYQQNKRKFKQWWSTFPPISTHKKESLNNDGRQFYQYQQNKETLNSDGQHFHKYQPNREIQTVMVDNSSIINKTKESLDSDVNISTNINKAN